MDNLPLQLTSFVGREREVAEIKQLLQEPHFLTLTGAGGSGKTRLAIKAVEQASSDYSDGVTYVSLASTMNPEQVVKSIACHRLRSELGIDYHPYDQSMVDQSTADTEALLDESAFEEA